MANKNFVVHNGLTVGPLEIDAANGNLITQGSISADSLAVTNNAEFSGNISAANIESLGDISAVNLEVSGDLDVTGNITITGDLGVSQISKNDSSISINDTGTSSTVVIAIDGATEVTVDSAGIKLPSSNELYINDVSVLSATALGTGVTASSLTTVGNLTTLAASGTVRTTGQLFANSNVATSSTATGAVVVTGGVGISGGLQTGADIFIAGKAAATVDDATALSIALGG
jgi:cytoskeletal protein CcmA (bactofilin family)